MRLRKVGHRLIWGDVQFGTFPMCKPPLRCTKAQRVQMLSLQDYHESAMRDPFAKVFWIVRLQRFVDSGSYLQL